MSARRLKVALATVAMSGSACIGTGPVRARAAADLGCPEGKLTVESRELHGFEVTGCGKRASYVLRGGEVLSDTGGELPGMRDLHED